MVFVISATSIMGKTPHPPPILEEYKSKVIDYIIKLRNVGSIVNRHILIAGANEMDYKDHSLLSEIGKPIVLN